MTANADAGDQISVASALLVDSTLEPTPATGHGERDDASVASALTTDSQDPQDDPNPEKRVCRNLIL